MNKISLEYGVWLSTFRWTHIATIRRHFRLTEFNIEAIMLRLIKTNTVKKIFYVVEPDRQDNMTHVHLLIEADLTYNKARLIKEIGVNKKAVCYFDVVKDVVAVSYYCSKYISSNNATYDLITR